MALRLTPPTKYVFYASILLAAGAFVLYLLGVLGAIEGGFAAIGHFAFWIAMFGWGLLAAGVAMKGV
ncbi:MAG: hypothetical protein ACRECX_14865 [Methyloceanibacter sp.]|uniref:hypothetical protein n=1 Tax=Methyloceanibacter sp. TaxID=1965321 RepID=UPI003D6D54F9